ncbi:MAG: type II toxin-antitoxin system VapB family antitoxin [Bifidobacteriaceae bacterium]|jgi:antitoxin VapB|nr:type II toxin-antitoxin system VapB family antitoxin [Bifidobacteriaceae bacterium]
MSLNLKNPETIALVRELADRTGTSQTAAITDAVRRRLDDLASADPDSADERSARVDQILNEIWNSENWPQWAAQIKANTDDLYDETGLPK